MLGALAEKRSHVPYRNSSLTHFLQDSIGTHTLCDVYSFSLGEPSMLATLFHSHRLILQILLHISRKRYYFVKTRFNQTHFTSPPLLPSTGGDAKFVLFLCISPTVQYLAESIRVLGFGSRARQVQHGPPKKHRTSASTK